MLDTVNPIPQFPEKARNFSRGTSLGLLILAAAIASCAFGANAPPSTLAENTSAAFSGAFEWGRTYPAISNGYLVSFTRTNLSDSNIPIVLFPLATHVRQDLSFTAFGTRTVIADIAVSSAHQLLLAGSYTTSSSQDASTVNFISQVDLSGHVLKTSNTGTYGAQRICAAGDGTYWTLGQPLDSQGAADPNSGMLRHYGVDGSLVNSYLPVSSLPKPQATLNLHAAGSIFGLQYAQAQLSCGPSTVGVFLGAPENVWLEVDQTTGKSQQWIVPDSSGIRITGMVLASKHAAYASLAVRGLVRLAVDDAGGSSWTPVTEAAGNASGAVGQVLGMDNGALVYARGVQTSPGDRPVFWGVVK